VETTASATRRGIAIGLALALMAAALWSANEDRAEAAAPETALAAPFLAQVGDNPDQPPLGYSGEWFAKYDGVDGESESDANHDKWIDILRYEWGLEKSGGGATGTTRRRASATLDPFVLTFDYEKASPKILEKCFKGEIIPKLEVELTFDTEEERLTYLAYEMKNVGCEAYHVGGWADGTRPTVVVVHFFEEIKVTYTEYDSQGGIKGNVETILKVEKGL